jgi:hypothetical protein
MRCTTKKLKAKRLPVIVSIFRPEPTSPGSLLKEATEKRALIEITHRNDTRQLGCGENCPCGLASSWWGDMEEPWGKGMKQRRADADRQLLEWAARELLRQARIGPGTEVKEKIVNRHRRYERTDCALNRRRFGIALGFKLSISFLSRLVTTEHLKGRRSSARKFESVSTHANCSKTVVVLCSKPSTTEHDASTRRACIPLRNQVE